MNTNIWKIIGILAMIVIMASPFIYIARGPADPQFVEESSQGFVGSQACKDCHLPQYDKWRGSHHDHAMDVASDISILGNFDNAVFEHDGVRSLFYNKDGRFFVHTSGPGGEMGDFEITHTFGWFPLQQYLIPFQGGRLQCLPIAWDCRDQQWYHLYEDDPPEPDSWLHWTNAGLNWNGMCAECHSTNLKKNFNPETEEYNTTWSDIDVGCEACHGPGARHVAWANFPSMGRPAWDNAGLVKSTLDMNSQEQNELCAPCHSRRTSLGDNDHGLGQFMDYAMPRVLSHGLYYPDGQILDEVYVYGSFMQSKMYERGVRCSDCHDVHSIKRHKEGNDLCLQCHKERVHDTKIHHFHKKAGEKGEAIRDKDGKVLFEVGTGAQCEQCHMPGRTYMGVDYRPEHSFRRPMPRLSADIGVPNACNRCHIDKDAKWSRDHMKKWYGEKLRPHYGEILALGRNGDRTAKAALVGLAGDSLYPAIVRATALSLLGDYPPGPGLETAFDQALNDQEPLIRYTAVRSFHTAKREQVVSALAPLLYDPIRAVRIEAAARIAELGAEGLGVKERKRFDLSLEEYEQAMRYTADFAPSRHNLGNLYSNLGRPEEAEEQYQKAMAIDAEFIPARVNLAMLYNQQGKKRDAEKVFRDLVTDHPDFYEGHYSLGLLLAEQEKWEEAALALEAAAQGMPDRSRIFHNLGQILAFLGNGDGAEKALARTLELEPANRKYLATNLDFYLRSNQLHKAKAVARSMLRYYPDWTQARQLLESLEE